MAAQHPMPKAQRLVFHIDAYTPATMPMAQLAAYLTDFATLLGKEHAVHFGGLSSGSTILTALVDAEDVPKVTNRLADVRTGHAPKDAAKAYESINNRLAHDNATGRIYGEDAMSAELLAFPGRERPLALTYGPFNQDGHLDGRLISVGGKDDTINVRLQNGDVTFARCETDRATARVMARHLFETVRIHGTGRWIREADGTWTLLGFKIHAFEVLEPASLREAVRDLRAVGGSEWRQFNDPLAELADMRRDEDEAT